MIVRNRLGKLGRDASRGWHDDAGDDVDVGRWVATMTAVLRATSGQRARRFRLVRR